MKILALLLLLHLPSHATGFANGAKIGEVTPTSTVLWTRLTENTEPGNRVDKWTPDTHTQRWNPNDKDPEHRFLRVKGGFLSIRVTPEKAVATHHDVDGTTTYLTDIKAD